MAELTHLEEKLAEVTGLAMAAEAAGGRVVEEHTLRLDEIFVARAGAAPAASGKE